jgi:hypothetical protein
VPTICTASRLYAIRNYWDMNTPTLNEAKRIREWLEGLTEAVGNVENAQTDIGIRTAQAFLLGLR